MNTTISISKETRSILQEFGKKSENYDDIIRRMYNEVQLRELIEEFVDESSHCTIEEAIEYAKLKVRIMEK